MRRLSSGGPTLREQEWREATERHKASGGDPVEVETIADNVRAQGFAAVVLGLVVALPESPAAHYGLGPVNSPRKAHLYV